MYFYNKPFNLCVKVNFVITLNFAAFTLCMGANSLVQQLYHSVA